MTELIVEQADLSGKLADALTLALVGSLACLPFAFLVGTVLMARRAEAMIPSVAAKSVQAEVAAHYATRSPQRSATTPWSSPTGCQTRTLT